MRPGREVDTVLRRFFIPIMTALAVLLGSTLLTPQARADSVISDSASITKAANWIADQWRSDAYTSADPGLLADGVMALASARQHREVLDEMLSELAKVGPSYVNNRPDALAKVLMTADIAGVKDPAHFFGQGDLVEDLKTSIKDKDLSGAWAGYLSVIALSRLGRLGELGAGDMDYLFTKMAMTKDGGFGWSTSMAKGDPDFTGIGISAMLLASKDQTIEQAYRDRAAAALQSGISWAANAENRFTDTEGDYYWMANFNGTAGASSNSTGMLASALAEAGVNIESPKRAMKREQAATSSGAAWSNLYMNKKDDLRATVQAIFAITGTGYATARWEAPRQLSGSTPKITGTAQVGRTLTASAGTWTSGTALTYQWYRDGKAISGAKGKTHTLTSGSLGKKITVAITGKKSGYTSVTKTSAKTSTVKAGTLSVATPKITGTLRVGKTLAVKAGTWTSGTALTYQWYRNGKAISGAKGKSHTLTSGSRGKRITVKVTGKKSGYATRSKTSARTAAVK